MYGLPRKAKALLAMTKRAKNPFAMTQRKQSFLCEVSNVYAALQVGLKNPPPNPLRKGGGLKKVPLTREGA